MMITSSSCIAATSYTRAFVPHQDGVHEHSRMPIGCQVASPMLGSNSDAPNKVAEHSTEKTWMLPTGLPRSLE